MPLGKLALCVALDSLRAGRPFVVFCLRAVAETSPTLHWYSDATPKAAAGRARHATATSDCDRYALVVQEEVRNRDGELRLAAIAEVGDREHDNALRLAQHYEPFAGPDAPLSAMGNPMMLGDTDNVLRGSALDPGRPAALVVVCPKCSKRNRVTLDRVRDRLPKCGACGESLLQT